MDNNDISKCRGRRLEVLNNNQTLTIADLTSINLSTPIDRRDFTSFSGSARLNLQSDQGSSSIFRQNYVATDSNCTRLNLQSRIYDQGTSSSLFQDNHVATNSSNDQCEYNLRDDVMEIPTSDGYATHDTFDGPPTEICEFCGALVWKEERNNKSQKGKKCTFSMCCKVGEIKLTPPKPTPAYLKWLIFNSDHFRHNFRAYNSIFSFPSSGGIVDHNINKGRGLYCYRINGQNIHLLGSLLPPDGRPPKLCQLYIYDTENEVDNRVGTLHGDSNLDPNIVDGLMKMLDEHNELTKGFRMARDRFQECGLEELKLIFISSRSASGRPNHIGPSNEVGALLVGASDDQTCATEHDIIVQRKEGCLHRVYETNKFFMALQYPLLFPHGESGFHLKIPYNTVKGHRKKKREHVTLGNGILMILCLGCYKVCSVI
ncbi:uncharacterized protein LOC141717960 isoform X2 [Apium graveolens]|uniref:uncharacterized protein LOC141717960 isoform X2 n=1 Tax=Apium graveolens TaxID=4045 RepID=UPI003D78EF51